MGPRSVRIWQLQQPEVFGDEHACCSTKLSHILKNGPASLWKRVWTCMEITSRYGKLLNSDGGFWTFSGESPYLSNPVTLCFSEMRHRLTVMLTLKVMNLAQVPIKCSHLIISASCKVRIENQITPKGWISTGSGGFSEHGVDPSPSPASAASLSQVFFLTRSSRTSWPRGVAAATGDVRNQQ